MYIQNKNSKKWESKLELLDKQFYNKIREDIKKVIFYSNTINGAVYHVSSDKRKIYNNSNVNKLFFTPEKDINYNFNSYQIIDFIVNTNYDISNINTTVDNTTLLEGNTILLNNQIDTNQLGVYTYKNNILTKQDTLKDIVFVKNGLNKDTYWKFDNINYVKTDYYLIKNKINYLNINENYYYDIALDNGINLLTNTITPKKIYIGDNGLIIVDDNGVKNILYNTYKYKYNSIALVEDCYIAVGELGSVIKIDRRTLDITKIDLGVNVNFNKILVNQYNTNDVIIIGDNNTVFFSINNGKTFSHININIDKFANIYDISFKNNKSFQLTCSLGLLVNVDYAKTSSSFTYTDTIENIKYKTDLNKNNQIIKSIYSTYNSTILVPTVLFDDSIIDIPRTIGDGDFTIDFWLQLTTPNNNVKYIMSRGVELQTAPFTDNTFYYGFNIYVLNNIIYFQFGDLINSPITIDTKNAIVDSKYHNISITRSNGIFKIYIDDILKDSITSTYTGGLNSNYKGNVIRIGGKLETKYDGTYTTSPVDGAIFKIQNLRLFNSELSATTLLKYKNVYTELPTLVAQYSFIRTNGHFVGNDISKRNDAIYSYNLNDYDDEYICDIYTTQNKLIVKSDSFYNSTKSIVYNFNLAKNKYIKTFVYNNTIYVLNDNLYYINIADLNINVFNDISDKKIDMQISKNGLYRNYKLDNNILYLLGYNDVTTFNIDNQLEKAALPTITLNVDNTFTDKIKFGGYDSVKVSDNLTEAYYEYDNLDYAVIFNNTTASQSFISGDVTDYYDMPLVYSKQYTLEINIHEIYNSILYVSLDNINFFEIKSHGQYKVLLAVGVASKIYIKAVPIISTKKLYVDIKNILISNKLTFDYDRIDTTTFKVKSLKKPEIQDSATYYKYYFNQFTDIGFASYKNAMRKYINVKSLIVNDAEVLNLTSYFNNDFPKILFTGSAITMSCNSTNCVVNANGTNYDRFIDSIGFTKDNDGLYVDSNTNILTYLDVNTDISYINNGVVNINSPFYIKSLNDNSFKLTVESVCVTMSNTVGQLYHTYSGGVNSLNLNKLNLNTSNNITAASTTHSNLIIATNSSSGIINILCTIDGKPLVENTTYRLDLQFLNPLTSSIGIHLGAISNYGITVSATASKFIGLNIKKSGNSDVYISGITYSNIKLKTTNNTSFQLQNLFLSSVASDIYEIEFDKTHATYSYLKNGNKTNGFLNRNGSFINLPTIDTSTYSSSYTNSVSNYIDYKENRFLFMDYDIGSKLSFFNKNLEYNTPNTIKFSYEAAVNNLAVTNIPNEYNWLNYYKDNIKSPRYLYANANYEVLFSSYFRKTSGYNYLTINSNMITTTFSNIGYIMPNFATSSTSLSYGSITPSNCDFDVYWHNNRTVVKATYSFSFQVGDVVLIEHDVLSSGILATVVYSNIYTVNGNDYKYTYLSNVLNESIINDMKSSGTMKLTNLNLYTNNNDLISNFNKHHISKGYNMKSDNQYVYITPLINNSTVYYNMQSRVEITEDTVITYDSIYNSSFTNFKYTPNYSIKNILLELNDTSNDAIFSDNYTFDEMSLGYDLLLDNSDINISDYEISFDASYLVLYNNYFKYTFIDIIIYNISNTAISTQTKLLILDKYISNGKYVLKLHKKLALPNNSHHVDILSRNKLSDISSDLNELNNIQPNINDNSIGRSDFKSMLPFKINTESYYKILSNDINIKNQITSICYTDNNNILNMSMLKNDKKVTYDVSSITAFATYSQYCSFDYAKFGFTTSNISTYSSIYIDTDTYITSNSNFLRLINSTNSTFYINTPYLNDEYLLKFDIANLENSYAIVTTGTTSTTYSTTGVQSMVVRNATYSKIEVFTTDFESVFDATYFKIGNYNCILPMTYSKINIFGSYSYGSDRLVNLNINSTYSGYYNGYNIIKTVISDDELLIYKEYQNATHTGSLTVLDFDPYLDFVPTDISKIGSDLRTDIYTKIEEHKLSLNEYLELSSVDMTKKKYRLVDGLTIYDIYSKYKWLVEAEIEDAMIGEDVNGLIWYTGKWHYGRWFGNIWYSGEWYQGEWYSGTMYSKDVTIIGDNITINNNVANKTIWYDGSVHNGELYNITWVNGNFYNGVVNSVYWIGGNFHNGNMLHTHFNGGTFINGSFIGGDISQIYDDVNWLNGDLKSGNFKNGTFHNGIIQEYKGGKTYFGSDTSNDRKATIISGNILAGNIGNAIDDNTTIDSAYISYANITNTTIKNSDLKNGDITNSILDDIDIVAINLTNLDQYIVVKGLYNFNIGYVLYIMDSNNNYLQIKVKDYLKTINEEYTLIPIITTNYNINQGFNSDIIGVNNVLYNILDYKLVSYISNVNWLGGAINNGVFDGLYFKGLFKKGLFKSGTIG